VVDRKVLIIAGSGNRRESSDHGGTSKSHRIVEHTF
jgi:hypothetical protein